MKNTDLEKLAAKKIETGVNRGPAHAGRLPELDRRERRRRDQELGLVPFAVKIDGRLAERLRELARARGGDLNGVVGEVLKRGLGEP